MVWVWLHSLARAKHCELVLHSLARAKHCELVSEDQRCECGGKPNALALGWGVAGRVGRGGDGRDGPGAGRGGAGRGCGCLFEVGSDE